MPTQNSEKILLRIVKIGLYVSLLIPFFAFEFFAYPHVLGQAFVLQLLVELLLPFYLTLILLYPHYRPNLRSNITRGILIFSVALIFSTLFSVDPHISFWGYIARSTGLFTLFHFLLYYFMLVSVFQNTMRSFLRIAVISGGVMAVIVIFQTYFDSVRTLFPLGIGDPRPAGTLDNPNFLGAYLLFFAYFTIFLWLQEKNRIVQYGLVIIEIIIAWALLLNGTRSVFVGIIASLIAFAVITPLFGIRVNRRLYRITIVSLLVTIAFFSALLFNVMPEQVYQKVYFFNRVRNISITGDTRLIAWQSTLPQIRERPIFGYGLENFSIPFNQAYDLRLGDFIIRDKLLNFDKAHNKVVELLLTTGIIGIAAYGALWVLVGISMWKARNKSTVLVLALLSIANGMHLMFSMDTPATYLLTMVLFALIGLQTGASGTSSQRRVSLPITAAVVVGVVLILGVSAQYTLIRPALASYHVSRAKAQNQSIEEVFEQYRLALSSNSIYNHDIVRDMGGEVLSQMLVYEPQYQDIYAYIGEQLEQYDNAYDWQKILFQARLNNILCDTDKTYCHQALEYIAAVQSLAPNRARVFIEEFVIHYKLQDYASARASFESALKRGFIPEDLPMVLLIADVYYKNEEYTTTLEYYIQARELLRMADERIRKLIEEIQMQAERESTTVPESYIQAREILRLEDERILQLIEDVQVQVDGLQERYE